MFNIQSKGQNSFCMVIKDSLLFSAQCPVCVRVSLPDRLAALTDSGAKRAAEHPAVAVSRRKQPLADGELQLVEAVRRGQ